jgi:3-oxoacyl-[acyl-carrier protein] reductase
MSSSKDNKVALVTGAAMGIGAAIAEQLAQDGMTVLVSDLNREESAKTAARFRAAGLSAQPIQLDVGNADSIAAFSEISASHGRCDVLVNNAGIAKTFPFIDFPLDNFLATMG